MTTNGTRDVHLTGIEAKLDALGARMERLEAMAHPPIDLAPAIKEILETMQPRPATHPVEPEGNMPKVWKPKKGERYWILGADGDPATLPCDDDPFDLNCYAIGNCFPTSEAAERERDRCILIADMRRWCEERGMRIEIEVCARGKGGFASANFDAAFRDRLHLLSDE